MERDTKIERLLNRFSDGVVWAVWITYSKPSVHV